MTTWMVIGSKGQLGSDLMRLLDHTDYTLIGLDLPDIDITDTDSVMRAFSKHQPDVIVNAAAYTAVDDAESEPDLAMAVNGRGPQNIAEAVAKRHGSKLIQLSTDYVFDGEATTPYAEDAEPNPKSVYGRTKLAGEEAVRRILPDHSYVVRTAWMYGHDGNNFVRTMIKLERQKDEIRVVDDQRGQPTYSRDLARHLVALQAAKATPGIYHGTASGDCTWYEFAREIFRQLDADPDRVKPTTSEEFPRPAPRPAYSVLGHDAWHREGLEPLRGWEDAITRAMPRMRAIVDAD